MEVYPAIDIMNGEVVRLRHGNPADTIRYNHLGSPLSIARTWQGQGAEMLHIIDMDATLRQGDNYSLVGEIVEHLSIPIQFGGGIRDEGTATRLLNLGVERIILGTLAVESPSRVIQIGESYGFEHIVVALDYLHDMLVTDGWRRAEFLRPHQLLSSLRSDGVCHFLMTSVENDGLMCGPDSRLNQLCGSDLSDIIVAGGVTRLEDVQYLATQGFNAAVVGRALYEGTLSLSEAIAMGRGFDT
ncbi:MAG: 1-(5-phosphoribosyl)-5-[(5-phosphoribosylamino)methylideneamino] imidazole-4-carboxamide isomerase [Candidatus Thorarchaeota archaeon]